MDIYAIRAKELREYYNRVMEWEKNKVGPFPTWPMTDDDFILAYLKDAKDSVKCDMMICKMMNQKTLNKMNPQTKKAMQGRFAAAIRRLVKKGLIERDTRKVQGYYQLVEEE